MSYQDIISPYNIDTISQADKWRESRKISIRRLSVDPIMNFPN